MITQMDLDDAFGHIVFYENLHRYIDTNTGEQLVSVTTEKKNYLNPFDPNMVKYSARKHGVTVEWLQAQWDKAGLEGRLRGTLLHNYCQNLAYRKYMELDMQAYPHMENLVNQIHNFFEDYKHWKTIAIECVIGDDKNAGQFDRLVTCNDEVFIVDYKFQKSFKEAYNKQTMTNGYEQFPQDTLHEYGWQMSKYKQILEKKGFKIDGLKLVHFNYEDTQYKIYDAPQIKII
jgi:hypothetical protein